MSIIGSALRSAPVVVESTPAHLFVCGQLISEVRAAVAADPTLVQIQVHPFPARCGAPPVSADEIDRQLALLGTDEPTAWIGGSCLAPHCRNRGDAPSPDGPALHLERLGQCFDLVCAPEAVDEALRAGAYLCTPGWLAGWRGQLRELGLDSQALARELFAESVASILLLDTGHRPQAAAELAELAAHLDRPAATRRVGLETLRQNLRLIVLRARLTAERRQAHTRIGVLQ